MYLLIMAALVACGDKPDDTGPDTNDTAPEEAFAPTTGTWQTDSNETLEDGCGFGDEEPDTAEPDEDTWQLEDNGDGTFRVHDIDDDPDTTDLDITCTLTDMDFTCETWEVGEETMDGVDATLTITADMTGSFSSETAITVNQVMSVDCAGTQCKKVESYMGTTFPCEVTAVMQGSFVE